MSLNDDDCDDLEKTLMLAAADADARNNEVQRVSVIKRVEPENITSNDTQDSPQNLKRNHKTEPTNPQKSEPEVKPHKRSHSDDGGCKAPKHLRTEQGSVAVGDGYASVVASHYNTLEEKGLDERCKSRIFYMRNFHNWIKSMLINENLTKIKDGKKHNVPVRVMDMCCGKGGDLLKWRKGGISHLICSDIAAVSLDQCKSRYIDMANRNSRDRHPGNLYTIEYIAADCSRVRLREKYQDPSMKLDLVSCQFAFHYSFESLPQAECMVRNASECLQPGGFFIGTIPDANELVARVRKSGGDSFGNDIFHVDFDCDVTKPPLFGAKYNFHLDGVVDCPEFLVHFPTLVELAKKYGLKLVRKEKFHDFFERMKYEGKNLLGNMKSLETFPNYEGTSLVGTAPDDYAHVDEFLSKNNTTGKIGTLSKSEWEASSVYMSFVFEKVKHTWNVDGTPKFDI